MKTAKVRSLVRTLVDGCFLNVAIRYHGHLEHEGLAPQATRDFLQDAVDQLWTRMTTIGGWGTIQDVVIKDQAGRNWILHLWGENALTGAILAVGPVGGTEVWSVGQVLEVMAAAAPSGPAKGTVVLPAPYRETAPDFRIIRRKFQPALLESIRQGDRPGLDALLENMIVQWPNWDLDKADTQVRSFLAGFITLCEEAAIQGGLDPRGAEDLGERYAGLVSAARGSKDAILAAFPLMRHLAEGVAQSPFRGKSAKSRALVRYLMKHLDRPVTLTEAATQVGLSPNYAGTLLRQEGGEGYSVLVHRLRIHRAQVLLRSTDLPVAEVARRVGYRHSNHFSRTFKAYAGHSPRDYRYSVSEIVGSGWFRSGSSLTKSAG